MGDWGLGGSRPEVEDVVGGFDCSVITGFFFLSFISFPFLAREFVLGNKHLVWMGE